jgi:pimeloyl-ACP methyl ester carboxylesterase
VAFRLEPLPGKRCRVTPDAAAEPVGSPQGRKSTTSPPFVHILPDVHATLDALIAELQAATGRAQVDLLGHSLGAFVSQTYLAPPARAANVAHYVNIDGGSAAAPPGGVPTLALWAGAAPPVGEIVGALNVTLDSANVINTTIASRSGAPRRGRMVSSQLLRTGSLRRHG